MTRFVKYKREYTEYYTYPGAKSMDSIELARCRSSAGKRINPSPSSDNCFPFPENHYGWLKFYNS